MSKAGKSLKRVLSVILTLTMLFTTFVFFDISATAAAFSALNVTDNGNGNPVYLYVPEQIYLKPKVDSYKAQGRSNFQWFVDSAINEATHVATPKTGESPTGNFYFYYQDASKVTVSYKYLNADGTDMVAYTSSSDSTQASNYVNQNCTVQFDGQATAISASNTRTSSSGSQYIYTGNTVNTKLTQAGLSPFLTASSTGCYIEWTVRFVDNRDGLERAVKAYTYVYKPYVQPVGVAVRCACKFYNDHFNSHIAWVSGVHGSDGSGGYYPKSGGGDGSLVPFASSNAEGYKLSNLYFQFSTSIANAANNYFDWHTDNTGAEHWVDSSSSTNFTQKTFNWANSTDHNPSGTGTVYALEFVASPLAKLSVDNSRYTNLSQIPNLSVGMMITDDEHSDSGKGAHYLANFAKDTTADTQTNTSSNNKGDKNPAKNMFNGYTGDVIYKVGDIGGSGDETDGLKYNGRWTREINSSSPSGRYDLRSGYWNTDSDWATSVGGIHVQITMTNKSSLRTALDNAMKITGRLGLDINESSAYYNTNSAEWKNFVALYKAAGRMLTALDTQPTVSANGTSYSTPASLASALNTAVNNIENARLSSTANVRVVALTTDLNGNYITDYVTTKATGAINTNDTKTYKFGNTISVTTPSFAGYDYVGYSVGSTTAYGKNLGNDYSSALAGTSAPPTKSYAAENSIGYTLYYVPKTLTATVKTNSGTYNLLKTQTGDLPSLTGIGFPAHAASSSVDTDFNYTIEDNDVIAYTSSASTAQKFVYLPFYADLNAATKYLLTYSVAGADASDIEFSFYNADFFGGDSGNTSNYTVAADGTFTTGALDSGRAYLRLELSGNARSGKEFRISDLCLTLADKNALYLDTTQGYGTAYTPTSTDKTGMSYNASSSNSFTVTSKYSTLTYEQKQLLPYYVNIQPGCTYKLDYDVSGIDAANVVFELYSNSFTGGNSSSGTKYYAFSGSGSTITTGLNDKGVAQLRVSYVAKTTATITAGTTASVTNLYLDNLTSQTVVEGKTNETFTLGIPVREGYKFSGWTITGAATAAANGALSQYPETNCYNYVFGTDSDIIEANWTADTYKVIFRNVDGEVYSTQEVAKGGTATAPNVTPVLFGHTFSTWDTPLTNVQSNLYIEPVYTPIDINVNLDKASTTIYQRGTDTVTATF
ncbi:MAG: hypothetical protein MJ168_03600, partial [Clostridia bacterium]|nr:hypothetical protein [Clostridia bacterium]